MALAICFLCWIIWKWGNNVCFGSVSPPINYKIDAICRALKENGHGSHVSSSVRLKEELFLCWDKLANGWCKSNTDGSWFQDINCECKGSY